MLFFKLPFDKNIFTVNSNYNHSFVSFTSFDESQHINFTGDLVKIEENELTQKPISSLNLNEIDIALKEENKSDYVDKLKNVIHLIKENQLEKLVISRRKIIKYSELDIKESFNNLCENYPNAFVYFFIENNICWMGAFSEILGKFNKDTSEFETMSLAGTLPLNENWSQKEIQEQKTVTDYIRTILMDFSAEIDESESFDHNSGNIKHLRTDFTLKIEQNSVEKLITKLHPTPAVCGIPKKFCKEAIQNFEKYPREFYAGFSKIETEEYIYYFVNLRCGKFYKNEGHLFVGGGITKDSNPEKEWRETELKAEAVAKNLVFL